MEVMLGVAILWAATAPLIRASIGQARPLAQDAAEGELIFQQRCAACHTIGSGRLVGPDLQGVASRRDINWLKQFITVPDQMIAKGDPTALQLFEEYGKVAMPNMGLSEIEVQAVLAYLESSGIAAHPAQAAAPTVSITSKGEPVRGKAYFTGEAVLVNGGVSCIACHSVEGVGALGGGSLGPDLTQVITRYGGSPGLVAVFTTLPFPSMQSSFAGRPLTAQEQEDLLAYLEQAASAGTAPQYASIEVLYLGFGIGGALLFFGIMAMIWPMPGLSYPEKLRQRRNLNQPPGGKK